MATSSVAFQDVWDGSNLVESENHLGDAQGDENRHDGHHDPGHGDVIL